MPVCPEKRYAVKQAIATKTPQEAPNSSIPIRVHASGVLVAPEKTATKPIPAKRAIGKGIYKASAFPKVAPIKNKGVTSPPLKPAPRVNEVNSIFSRKSYGLMASSKDAEMVGMPSPINWVEPMAYTAAAIIIPPITGLIGGYLISFLNKLLQKWAAFENSNAAKPKRIPAKIAHPSPSKVKSGTKGIMYCVCPAPKR